MSRSVILTLLINLWICAIVAPAVVTIMHNGDQTCLVMNLNEEEQQEGIKNIKGEKQMVHNQIFGLSDFEYQPKNDISDMNKITASSDMAEIILPPPEFTS